MAQNTRTECGIQVSQLLFLYSHPNAIFLALDILVRLFGAQHEITVSCSSVPFPSPCSFPPSVKYILRKDHKWNILWEISTDCYLCHWSSGICHCAWNISGTSLSSILFTTSKTNAERLQLVKIWSSSSSISSSNDKAFGENNCQKNRMRFWWAFKPCFMWN